VYIRTVVGKMVGEGYNGRMREICSHHHSRRDCHHCMTYKSSWLGLGNIVKLGCCNNHCRQWGRGIRDLMVFHNNRCFELGRREALEPLGGLL
jgi:hypothetical protein